MLSYAKNDSSLKAYLFVSINFPRTLGRNWARQSIPLKGLGEFRKVPQRTSSSWVQTFSSKTTQTFWHLMLSSTSWRSYCSKLLIRQFLQLLIPQKLSELIPSLMINVLPNSIRRPIWCPNLLATRLRRGKTLFKKICKKTKTPSKSVCKLLTITQQRAAQSPRQTHTLKTNLSFRKK